MAARAFAYHLMRWQNTLAGNLKIDIKKGIGEFI
jgi:hypothetical protein